jgi:hypothetical protein
LITCIEIGMFEVVNRGLIAQIVWFLESHQVDDIGSAGYIHDLHGEVVQTDLGAKCT